MQCIETINIPLDSRLLFIPNLTSRHRHQVLLSSLLPKLQHERQEISPQNRNSQRMQTNTSIRTSSLHCRILVLPCEWMRNRGSQ